MLSKIRTLALRGIDGFNVSVEVDITAGLPSYSVVGLPDAAVKESKDRVIAAVRNSGFDFPPKRITVNLSPAERKKSGTHFDLPIALGVLAASGGIEKPALKKLENLVFIGELALDGSLRPVAGVLPMLVSLEKAAVKAVIVPQGNAREAAASGLACLHAANLKEVTDYVNGAGSLKPCEADTAPRAESYLGDFSEVKNQVFAKRALEIAAAGFHNVIMVGRPAPAKACWPNVSAGFCPGSALKKNLKPLKFIPRAAWLRAHA